MALPLTAKLEDEPAFRPLLQFAFGVLLTTNQVAEHFSFSPQHLHLMRRVEGRGPAFVTLPTGAVRYRAAEVLEWELLGNSPHLTIDRVILAAATLPGATPEFLDGLRVRLKAELKR